jgi:hypothetical protein
LHAYTPVPGLRKHADKEKFDGSCAGDPFLWMEGRKRPIDHSQFGTDHKRVLFPAKHLQVPQKLAGFF